MAQGRRPILVSLHALTRAEERWPELAPNRDWLRHQISTEINDALTAGRYATRIPVWALKPGRTPRLRHKNRTLRFAWTAEEDRLYLIVKRNGHISVVTAIKPQVDTLPS